MFDDILGKKCNPDKCDECENKKCEPDKPVEPVEPVEHNTPKSNDEIEIELSQDIGC